MAIRIRLDRLLVERQISLTDLSARIGITIANLSILKTNKARAIRFSTLDALCRELQCQPGELIERTPEPEEED
ncbi:MAG TPA: helix-turn-helix transcriptional regulator [Bryobacteraceae bacterium]|jgi:putative transcriptional regulator